MIEEVRMLRTLTQPSPRGRGQNMSALRALPRRYPDKSGPSPNLSKGRGEDGSGYCVYPDLTVGAITSRRFAPHPPHSKLCRHRRSRNTFSLECPPY